MKKPIDIDRPGKKKKSGRHHPDDPRQKADASTPAPRAAPTRPQAVASAPATDAAFKRGIAVLRSTQRPRKG